MNLLQETMRTDETSCNDVSITKYLTEMIVWISVLTVKKSNRHINCSKQCDCKMLPCWSILEAVPGSVQHNTAVDYVTKVPIMSGKELKSMKNDLQFR